VITVQNVSKVYSTRLNLLDGLRSRASETIAGFWALKGINLEVGTGEVFGLVGPNGSGKSTLLQIVAGLLQPSEGRVLFNGRVSALLELGAGFNPEFTGRENVILNSELSGFSKDSIDSKLHEIEEFAELGRFFDRPVKEYSTGMYVRLAFSSAIHGSPEILIVDEALAVGDARFANRCIQRLEELRSLKTTILFVSHDLGLMKRLCDQAALLWQGRIVATGSAVDVAKEYVSRVQGETPFAITTALDPSRQAGRSLLRSVALFDETGREATIVEAGKRMSIHAIVEVINFTDALQFGILLRNRQGIEVFGTNSRIEGVSIGPFPAPCSIQIRFEFCCDLVRGDYSVTVATQSLNGVRQHWLDDCLEFHVEDSLDYAGVARLSGKFTIGPL